MKANRFKGENPDIRNFSPEERLHPLFHKIFWANYVLLSVVIPEFEKRLDLATSIYKNSIDSLKNFLLTIEENLK
ncbi:hypothetical protein [Candidatus Harpocratesius sp.]